MNTFRFSVAISAAAVALLWPLLNPQFAVQPGWVIVTGASSGIGQDAARVLAERGYHVFAGVRKPKDLASAEQLHPSVTGVLIDVSDDASIAAARKTIEAKVAASGLPLVGLVNNAGVSRSLPMEILPLSLLDESYQINLRGVVAMTSAFVPLMKAGGIGGRIVNVGSVSGLIGTVGQGAYSAAKFGIEGISESTRLELQQFGISVSILNPGYIKTGIASKQLGENSPTKLVTREQMAPYQKFQDVKEAQRKINEKTASSVDTTSAAILHAISSPYPRTRYIPGNVGNLPAWVLVWVKWVLPDRLADILRLMSYK